MSVFNLSNTDEVIIKLASLIKSYSDESISLRGRFCIALSGGSIIDLIAKGLPTIKTDFTKWKIFFCDERVVPEDDNDSIYGAYKRQLLPFVNITDDQFIKIRIGLSVDETAEDYKKQIAEQFKDQELPKFDMIVLGMGPDGHTCSLFPEHIALTNTNWVIPIHDSPKPPAERITLGLTIINNAYCCIFVCCGKEKAEVVEKVILQKIPKFPAFHVKPKHGKVVWILDSEAGKKIKI